MPIAAAATAENSSNVPTCCHAEAKQAQGCGVGQPGPSGNGGSRDILNALFRQPQPLVINGKHVVCTMSHVDKVAF
jgi:hypothetical protein